MLSVLMLLQTATITPAVASQPAIPAKPKVVCKSFGATGSRLATKRICATAQEWDERERNDRETLTRMSENTIANGR